MECTYSLLVGFGYEPDILGGPYRRFDIGYFVILDNRLGLSTTSPAGHESLAVTTR
jgi:hypothetical protein